jgi:hypothetical protein
MQKFPQLKKPHVPLATKKTSKTLNVSLFSSSRSIEIFVVWKFKSPHIPTISSNMFCGNQSFKTLLPVLLSLCLAKTAMGQETPNDSLQINQFNTSISFRHDFCDRYIAVAEGRIALEDSIQGLSLTTTVKLGEYLRLDEDTGAIPSGYPGLMAVLMDEFCHRAGCTWRDTFAVTHRPPEDKTWTDIVVWTIETYDVSLNWWMSSVERMARGVAFTQSWYDASIIMVTEKPGGSNTFQYWAWLTPFDNNVWYMLVVTVAATASVYYLLEKINPKSDERGTQRDGPIEATFLVAISLTSHFGFEPRTTPARLLAFSVAFFALVVSASYTANLASFLVTENQPQFQYNSLEDVVRANVPMCVNRGSEGDTVVSLAFPLAKYVRLEGERAVIQGLRDGDCGVAVTTVSAWNQFQRNKTLTNECSLEWRGRAFENIPASFATKAISDKQCTNLLRDVLNIHMTKMRVDGFINEAWGKHLDQTSTNECFAENTLVEEDTSGQLSMINMGGIFIFHAMLTGAALLMAIVAKIYEKSLGKPDKSKRASSAITPPHRISAINNDGIPNHPLKVHQMPNIRFLDSTRKTDDVSVSSQPSDVELEVRKELKRVSAIQKTDMIALEDKLIAIMAKLEERDEEDKTGESNVSFVTKG